MLFRSKYLWEQFSAGLKDHVYHDFLIYTYMYLIHLEHPDVADLMSIKQAFTTLEENAVTGMYYLNIAFMMWIFKMNHLEELYEFLEDSIKKRVISTTFDIHFGNLLKLMAIRSHKSELEGIDETGLKHVYSEFMLGDKYKKVNGQIDVFAVEKEILTYQMSILPENEIGRAHV